MTIRQKKNVKGMNNSLEWSEEEIIDRTLKRKIIHEMKTRCEHRIKRKQKVEPKITEEKIEKTKCKKCNKKVNLANRILCRCNELYCPSHRFYTSHDCPFDYRTNGIQKIESENKKLIARKIRK